MGQKINPIGMRLQVNRTWDSRWFADVERLRQAAARRSARSASSSRRTRRRPASAAVIIERPHKKCRVTIHAARPGVIIGKKGADIEVLRKKLAQFTKSELHLNIVEVRKPEIDAAAGGREHRPADGAPGVLPPRDEARRCRTPCAWVRLASGSTSAGRLGGAEIARTEWYREGRVPLHTLRADIDYALSEAKTAYGIIGIKVWIFKGEILEHDPQAHDRRQAEAAGRRHAPAALAATANARKGVREMLQPKRTKFRKQFKGRIHGEAKGGSELNFGHFGLKATEPERVTARQIEAARRAITRHMKRQGRVWIRIFPDVPVSKKPTEVRMGKGKGSVDYWAAKVKPGRIMFEIDGVGEDVAREALRLAAMKLPVKSRFVAREDW